MSMLPKHFITPEEYLRREKNAAFRSEYFGGEIFSMAVASANHNLVVGNCVQTLGLQLKKKPCLVYPSDLKLRVEATGLYTYPDLFEGNVELDAIECQLVAAEIYDKVVFQSSQAESPSGRPGLGPTVRDREDDV